MQIESIESGRVLVTISQSELHRYGVEFATMGLSDNPTRVMLTDMLSVIEHMGIRKSGGTVTVECAQGVLGGCTLVFEIANRRRYLFECSDDLIAAALADALPDTYELFSEDGNYIVLTEPLDMDQALFLGEFASPQQSCDE